MTDERSLGVVIVDDEPPARLVLREYLEGEPDCRLVAECANGFEAVQAVHELEPDLLLLDIQMPKLDGFEVLEVLGADAPDVVFVTAHDEHALRAFELHAVDYLLKPVSRERFRQALERARGRRRRPAPLAVGKLVAAARPPGARLERIVVRDGAKVHVVPVDKLDYAEAQDDYVRLVAQGARHLKQQTLAELEAALDPQRFVRIHRSYLLNIDRLARIELYAKDSRIAILQDGTKLPLSRAGYARVQELL
jgi:two-component system LytT family response regulator